MERRKKEEKKFNFFLSEGQKSIPTVLTSPSPLRQRENQITTSYKEAVCIAYVQEDGAVGFCLFHDIIYIVPSKAL